MPGSSLHPWLAFDKDEARSVIQGFLSSYNEKTGTKGYIVGLSGGLDSSTSTWLAVDALGPDQVQALFLPGPATSQEDREHARLVASELGIGLATASVEQATRALSDELPRDLDRQGEGNVQARQRMTALYAQAEATDRLVLGTGNKSELLTGYFTKHGDGGVDVSPIGDLYKTQVRRLALALDVPEEIINRPPSAGLWAGQTDEEELGLAYDVLDIVLAGIEQQFDAAKIADAADVDADEVQRVQGLVQASQHKRNPPPIPKLGWRTVGVDWRQATMT